jgi:diguanylate cyclase (GGDEF)-like protein
MIPPSIPIDEARRLFALRRLQILDTAAEPVFDHITALAQKMFNAPFALISLVDKDRVWFKSKAGSDYSEAPRAISFCGHAIHDDKVFIVEDARKDERFCDNPGVIGAYYIRAYAGSPLHAPGGERIGTLCILDHCERTFTESEMHSLHMLAAIVEDLLCRSDDVLRTAYYDILTGLPNRLLMLDKLDLAIAHAEALQMPVAVLAVNIDQFKTINQSLGHQLGDTFLKNVARRIVDCVGSKGVVGRVGADEFVIVQMQHAPQFSLQTSLQTLSNKILERLAEPFLFNEVEISATASIGISYFPEDGDDANSVLACADIALTQAREDGRNTACFYTADARIEPHKRFQLYNELRHALLRSEFELHYQPEVDLRSGDIVGVEALLRWNHPRHGLLAPADFIEVAEESGLIVPIGEWVLQEACREAQHWRAAGFNAVKVAVNLSALQFKRNNLEQSVAVALRAAGLPAHCLELELTESILIGDNESTLARMQRLKALGVGLAIDDFGTGYSNLVYLRRFAFDKLKIDQSFVRRMSQSSEDLAIVTAIIQLADSLKLKTIAEGVENEQHAQQLRILGCSGAQGYLFAKPMSAEALRELLRNKFAAGNTPSSQHGLAS